MLMKTIRLILPVILLSMLVARPGTSQTQQRNPRPAPMYVTLWFDTEDYTSPEPDTIIFPLCKILEEHRIRATFKIVGEKARDLERKGQVDVIQALSRHDIGFHTTFHSMPPVTTAYLDRLDWIEGADEFARREEAGFRDTQRIFKRTPICYGQPGSAWAPQVFPVLRRWGVPLYLDEGTHVGLKGKPFYYGGLLNIYSMADRSTRMNLEGEADYGNATREFAQIHERLVGEGGGLISIYYHPNEFDHTEFWDAVIWSHGANPPRERWKLPKKRTPESRAQALLWFGRYLEFMQGMPGVRFVTGHDLVQMYADKADAVRFGRTEVEGLARSLASEVTFQQVGAVFLSPAESFSVLLRWYLREPGKASVGLIPGLAGPSRRERAVPGGKFERWEFRIACEDALNAMSSGGHVPPILWVGSTPVMPEDFLATLASEVLGENTSSTLAVKRGNFTAEHYAAEESSDLFNWVILPQGFRAPHVMDLARLQCWTLKPAARDDNVIFSKRQE